MACFLSRFFMGCAFAAACVSPAIADNAAPKWQPHVEMEGKWGTDRSLGEADIFLPIAQDDNSLLFGDLRLRLDDHSSREGNFGLGLRQQVSEDWIIGGYGFYDRRRTDNDNYFSQVTLGLEALSETLEFRINGYIPESGTQTIAGSGGTTGSVTGGGFQIITTGASEERALGGFDIEAGHKFELPGKWNVWAYGGGYHFNAGGYDNVTGPRGRIEFNYENLPFLGDGARATVGLEVQHDNVRDTQGFAIARLRVPLGFGHTADYDSLDALDQRMTSRIYRDVDIVSGKQPGPVAAYNAFYTGLNGVQYNSFGILNALVGLPASIVGSSNMFVLDGSAGSFLNNIPVVLNNNNALIGGGQTISISTLGGLSALVSLPGTRPTIENILGTSPVFEITGPGILANMNIQGGSYGIHANSAINAYLNGLNISGTADDAVRILNSSDLLFSNIGITGPGGGAEEGFQFNGTNFDILLNNILINNSNIGLIFTPGNHDNIDFINVLIDLTNDVALAAQIGAILNGFSGDITTENIGGLSDCLNNGTFLSGDLTANGDICF